MWSSKNTSEFKESKYEYPTNVATHTYVSKVKKRNPSPPHVEKVVTVIPTVVEHIAHQPRSRHIDVLQSRLEEIAKSVPSIEPLQQQIGEIRDKLAVPHKDHSPDIQALKSRLEEIAKSVPSIEPLQKQIGEIRDKLAVPHKDHSPDIQALKSRLEEIAKSVPSVGYIKQQIDMLAVPHKDHSPDIQALKSRLEEIAKSVPSIEPLLQQIGEIRDKLSVPHKDHSPDIHALKSRLEEIARSVPSVGYIKQQIDMLAVPHPDIQALKSRIDAMSNNTYSLVEKDGIVRVGPEFNMPSLPPVKGKAGVWEHAPPTLAVNGGMILHNPGFKDKFDPKDHAYLAIDKRTGQVFMSKD